MRACLSLSLALLVAVFFSHPVRTTAAPGSGAAELQSLVGHWKLDEGGGVTAMDSSGLDRHGTIVGGSYVTNGLAQITPNPYALDLDGVSGHIAIPDSEDWSLTPSSTLTISLWVTLLEHRPIFHVFGKRQGCGGHPFYQLARDGRGFFFMTDGGAVIANRPLAPGWLTHVAVTYDAGRVRLYMDGVLAGSGVAPMTTTPAGPLLFGTSGGCGSDQTFPGIVDEIRIYRAALSGAQIAELGARQEAVSVPLRPHADPVITWGPLTAYVGDILGPAQFNATVSLPGTLSYSVHEAYYHESDGSPLVSEGDPLPFGNFEACVEFTPTDPAAARAATQCTWLAVSYRTPRSSPRLVNRVALVSDLRGAIDPDANQLFQLTTPSDAPWGVHILDATTLETIGMIPALGVMALDGKRNRLYIAQNSSNSALLRVFDTDFGAELQSVALPYEVIDVAVNESTGIAYALSSRLLPHSNHNDYVLVALEASSSSVTTIALPGLVYPSESPRHQDGYLAVNVSTNQVYLAAEQELFVVDGDLASPSMNTIVDRLPYGESGRGLSVGVNRQTGNVYVSLLSIYEDETRGQTLLTVRRDAVSRQHFLASRLPLDAWRPDRLQSTNGEWNMAAIEANTTTNTIYVALAEEVCAFFGVLIAVDGTSGEVVSATLENTRNPPANDHSCQYPSISINPANGNIFWAASPTLHVYADAVVGEAATPAGENTVVSQPAATLTFASVQSGGTTSITALDPDDVSLAPLPQGFALGNRLAFSIETSASFTGQIEICFNASAITDPEVFETLGILHGVNGAWVNEPVTSRDFASGLLCTRVSSLSPFVIARYTEPTYGIVRLYDSARSFRAGSTAPIRLQVTDTAGLNLSAASLVVHAVELRQVSTSATAAVVDAGQSNPDQDFRFDASIGGSGGYVFNLKTTGLAAGSYELQFTVGTGQRRYSVPLQIR